IKFLSGSIGIRFKMIFDAEVFIRVVAPRASVKSFRLQPLPAKIFNIALMGMASDVPIGVCREHTINCSTSWFLAVHAVVLFILMLGNTVLMTKAAMAITTELRSWDSSLDTTRSLMVQALLK
ncbi:unnamed protein product, partial [Brassica oleracea]